MANVIGLDETLGFFLSLCCVLIQAEHFSILEQATHC